MLKTTIGQILVNDALPENMRDYSRVIDKKGLSSLLRDVAEKHPDDYRVISKKLADIGRRVATEFGGNSFGIEHMRKSPASLRYREQIQGQLKQILSNNKMTPQQRNESIIRVVGNAMEPQMNDVLKESLAAKNPLAMQVLSGSRGNKMNLASLLASDMLYTDHRDQVMALPVLRSYSEGLTPLEYWAGTYGARRGVMATKFATQDAGFLSKQLNQVAHRLVVTGDDYEDPEQQAIIRGMPVDTNDMDNEGSLLAQDTGTYKRNTVLTPKIMKDLERRGHKRLLIRTPIVGGSPDGGVYARDVGVRDRGTLPGRGEQVGLQAAQALSEPISQGQLSAKHSGGVAGQEKALGGFAYINQLVQRPKTFKGGAAHSTEDGIVERIDEAPAGGYNVFVGGKSHYVPHGLDLKVKRGETIEAGDVLSEGIPDPSVITEHKGNGEGKYYFVKAFRQAMRDAGMTGHRRNIELLARGLINHVQMTDEHGGYVPDDIVPYSTFEHTYQPRDGAKEQDPRSAVGQYLEKPVLHYTIGTKIRPSMLQNLSDFGIKSITSHHEAPPFKPLMVRAMSSLQHDPDFMVRQYGSSLKSGLLDAVHRGAPADELGTSFVPGLARSVGFGHQGLVRQPKPGTPVENEDMKSKKVNQLDLSTIKPLAPSGSHIAPHTTHHLAKLSADAHNELLARQMVEKAAAAKQIATSNAKVPLTRQIAQVRNTPIPKPVRSIKTAAGPSMGTGSTQMPQGGNVTPGATGTPQKETLTGKLENAFSNAKSYVQQKTGVKPNPPKPPTVTTPAQANAQEQPKTPVEQQKTFNYWAEERARPKAPQQAQQQPQNDMRDMMTAMRTLTGGGGQQQSTFGQTPPPMPRQPPYTFQQQPYSPAYPAMGGFEQYYGGSAQPAVPEETAAPQQGWWDKNITPWQEAHPVMNLGATAGAYTLGGKVTGKLLGKKLGGPALSHGIDAYHAYNMTPEEALAGGEEMSNIRGNSGDAIRGVIGYMSPYSTGKQLYNLQQSSNQAQAEAQTSGAAADATAGRGQMAELQAVGETPDAEKLLAMKAPSLDVGYKPPTAYHSDGRPKTFGDHVRRNEGMRDYSSAGDSQLSTWLNSFTDWNASRTQQNLDQAGAPDRAKNYVQWSTGYLSKLNAARENAVQTGNTTLVDQIDAKKLEVAKQKYKLIQQHSIPYQPR